MTQQFFQQLDKLYQEGNLNEIEMYLADALRRCEPQDRVTVLNEIGAFYRGISRYDQSEAAFLQALTVLEAAGQTGSKAYATVLLNLAGVYRLADHCDKAVELYDQVLEMLDPDTYEYASALNNYSLARQAMGQLDEAQDLAARALEWVEAHGAPAHEVATSLNNLAAICVRRNDTEQAAALLDRALAMYDAMPEPNIHHAAALYTRGVVHLGQGDLDRAESCFHRALELTDHFFGHNAEYQVIEDALEKVRQARERES